MYVHCTYVYVVPTILQMGVQRATKTGGGGSCGCVAHYYCPLLLQTKDNATTFLTKNLD
jgi:hypothetical protein